MARDAFWALALGVLVCFVFFVALGGVSLAQVATVAIVMLVLAGLWAARLWRCRGGIDTRDPRLIRARERRGF